MALSLVGEWLELDWGNWSWHKPHSRTSSLPNSCLISQYGLGAPRRERWFWEANRSLAGWARPSWFPPLPVSTLVKHVSGTETILTENARHIKIPCILASRSERGALIWEHYHALITPPQVQAGPIQPCSIIEQVLVLSLSTCPPARHILAVMNWFGSAGHIKQSAIKRSWTPISMQPVP